MSSQTSYLLSTLLRILLTPVALVRGWAAPDYTDATRQKLILGLSAILYFVQPSGLLRMVLYGRENHHGVVQTYVYRELQKKARQTGGDFSQNGEPRAG